MNEQNEILRNPHRFLSLVLALSLVLGAFLVYHHAASTPTYTIDSYFYLSKAKQLASGHGLRTTWNDGVDAKYFPGYSIFLAMPFLIGGSYVTLQMAAYILCVLFVFCIAKELEFDPVERALAATAFAANPIVIKWLSLPMAEGVALALSLLSVILFLRFVRTQTYPLLFAACMVGGIATVTRIEALFLLPVFGTLAFRDRKTLPWLPLLAAAVIFVLPLLVYWVKLRTTAHQGPAYLEEFRHTFLRFDLVKNFLYNVWVPFGFMHRPWGSFGVAMLVPVAMVAGAVWIALGELVFIGGLVYSIPGRLGSRVRAAALLFLAYALLHSLWYYRYERFMLMSLPLAALVWAAATRAAFSSLDAKKTTSWLLILAQVAIAASGMYWGNQYSVRHKVALQQDTSRLQFHKIADAVNMLNSELRSAVLTDLGPHLAYYLDAHTYLDTDHGNYWRRAFPPESTLEEMSNLGIGFVVTQESFEEWLEEHKIPLEAQHRFKQIENRIDGASIINYSP